MTTFWHYWDTLGTLACVAVVGIIIVAWCCGAWG